MLYIIHAKGTGYFKVGYTSTSAKNRLESMKTGCPHDLVVVWEGDGGRSYEKAAHEALEGWRVRGEWFRFDYDASRVVNGTLGEMAAAALASACARYAPADGDVYVSQEEPEEDERTEMPIKVAFRGRVHRVCETVREDVRTLIIDCGDDVFVNAVVKPSHHLCAGDPVRVDGVLQGHLANSLQNHTYVLGVAIRE